MLTRYLWDYATNTCLAEMDEQGETLVDYTVDPATGELISENHGGQEVYHRYDGDGNTRQTADSAGNVLGEATYSAFGETVSESGDMQTTYRFRGQRGFSTDPLTGNVSSDSQNYSPSLGRRLSLAGSPPKEYSAATTLHPESSFLPAFSRRVNRDKTGQPATAKINDPISQVHAGLPPHSRRAKSQVHLVKNAERRM